MKRSITRWTTTLATAALLGLPIAAAAQTQQPSTPPQQQQPAPQPTDPQQPTQPQPTQPPAQPQPAEPQPAQPPTQPQPAQPQPTQPQPTEPQPATPPSTAQQPTASAADQSVSPEEHLRQAKAALSDIKMTSIPARDRAQFNELRRHLSALENPSASRPSARTTAKGSDPAASASSNSWGTEVAAIDKIITNLAGSETAGAGTAPSAGTTGATGTSGTSRNRAAASTSIDEATRAKLMEIRTHITAYATAKAGAGAPRNDAASTANDAMTSAAQSGNATAGATPRSGNYSASESTAAQPSASSPQAPSAQGTTPAQNTPSVQGNTAGAQDPAAQPAAAAAPKVDTEAAHRSLLAARDSLNQLTQLPAAAQLTGEARTQVQQLIANFNELVTNTTDWRASYAKVATSLASLLGPEANDTQATAATPAPATPDAPAPATQGAAGTPGAVGTTGSASVQLDPAIRAKLVEMRTNLNEFQKASGGMEK